MSNTAEWENWDSFLSFVLFGDEEDREKESSEAAAETVYRYTGSLVCHSTDVYAGACCEVLQRAFLYMCGRRPHGEYTRLCLCSVRSRRVTGSFFQVTELSSVTQLKLI